MNEIMMIARNNFDLVLFRAILNPIAVFPVHSSPGNAA
jgi:hypothetical protein